MMFSAQMSMPEATIPKTTEETAMKKACDDYYGIEGNTYQTTERSCSC
jgi:hypothetical protein